MKLETTTTSKTTEFERAHIEEGVHTATLKEVKDIPEGEYGPRVAFIYEVEGKELAHVAYKKPATPDNGIGKTLIAHGVDLSSGEVDTNNLPNNQVKVFVEDYEYEQDGNKKKASGISKVKPLEDEESN